MLSGPVGSQSSLGVPMVECPAYAGHFLTWEVATKLDALLARLDCSSVATDLELLDAGSATHSRSRHSGDEQLLGGSQREGPDVGWIARQDLISIGGYVDDRPVDDVGGPSLTEQTADQPGLIAREVALVDTSQKLGQTCLLRIAAPRLSDHGRRGPDILAVAVGTLEKCLHGPAAPLVRDECPSVEDEAHAAPRPTTADPVRASPISRSMSASLSPPCSAAKSSNASRRWRLRAFASAAPANHIEMLTPSSAAAARIAAARLGSKETESFSAAMTPILLYSYHGSEGACIWLSRESGTCRLPRRLAPKHGSNTGAQVLRSGGGATSFQPEPSCRAATLVTSFGKETLEPSGDHRTGARCRPVS